MGLSPLVVIVLLLVLAAEFVNGWTDRTQFAQTIGMGIVRADVITLTTVAAAMVEIITWSTLVWSSRFVLRRNNRSRAG